jgi:pimeloyl-ACP methyl ester carboxylesterase
MSTPQSTDPSTVSSDPTLSDDGEAATNEAGAVGQVAAGVDEAAARRREMLNTVGRGAATAGWAIVRGASWAAGKVAEGYRSIDPDLRRHFAHAPLVGLTHLSPSKRTVTPLPDDGHHPVVFVHGLAGHPGNFGPMRAWFGFMGRTRTWSMSFEDADTLQEMADQLSQAVADVIRVNELPADTKVDIVAHSMGGLISRLALENPNTAAHVGTLVTLGTPHEGTQAARLAVTSRVLDLRPDSDVVRRLAEQLPWHRDESRSRLVALWSPVDMLLMPPDSARVPGAENVEMPGFTHLSYLIHPRAWQRVWSALEQSPS